MAVRERGIVSRYERDASGNERVSVLLPAGASWLHLTEGPAVLEVAAGSVHAHRRGEERHVEAGSGPLACRALEACVVRAGDDGARLRIRVARSAGSVASSPASSPGSVSIEPGAVRCVRLRLERDLRAKTPLEALGALAGVSKFHLARMFREHHGVPPHAYRNAVRVAHARSMLAAGASCAEAAEATGFADQSHFSRAFHASVGIAPRDYVAPSRAAEVSAESA